MSFHKVDHGTDLCYGFLKMTNTKPASGKTFKLQRSGGRLKPLAVKQVTVPREDIFLQVLCCWFCSVLPFCFTEWFSKMHSQAQDKRVQMPSIGGSVGPSVILPTAQTSIQTIYSLTV